MIGIQCVFVPDDAQEMSAVAYHGIDMKKVGTVFVWPPASVSVLGISRPKRSSSQGLPARMMAFAALCALVEAELQGEGAGLAGEGDGDGPGRGAERDGVVVAHDHGRGGALQLEAHVHEAQAGMPGDHVRDFAHGVLDVLHDVLDGVAEHLADDVHGGAAVKGDGEGAPAVAGDADEGGDAARGRSVLLDVGLSRHDFEGGGVQEHVLGRVDERPGQFGTHRNLPVHAVRGAGRCAWPCGQKHGRLCGPCGDDPHQRSLPPIFPRCQQISLYDGVL